MRKLFSMKTPLMKALSIAADLLILNILAVICSIPLITIGPSLTAMHDIVIRIVRGEEGYTVKPFFQAFKANFKKGLLLSVIILVSAAVLYFDYLAALVYIPILRAGIIAIGVIVLAILFYAFALLARYENSFKATLKNSVLLAIGNFPRTLFMIVCAIGLWVVCIHFYQFGIPILMMFGLSLPCYVNILLLNGVFRKLESSDDEEDNGS